VRFFVDVANFGYRFVWNAKLSLYKNVVSPSNLIATTTVSLVDLKNSVELTWIASGLGTHTIIAFVDPDNVVAETRETDNKGTLTIEVKPTPTPGLPDVSANPDEITTADIPISNTTNSVTVTVRNIGEVVAAAVSVTVKEVETGTPIGSYQVTIPASGQDTRQVTWIPTVAGARHIEVSTTFSGQEIRKSNNKAVAGFYVRPAGAETPCPTLPCPPPPPVDCIYRINNDLVVMNGQTVVFDECVVIVRGNVIVQSGGNLQFLDSTLAFVASTNGQYSITAQTGSTLIFSGSRFGGTVFSRGSRYASGFSVQSGVTFRLETAIVWWVWGDSASLGAEGGIRLRSQPTAFQGNQVREGRTHGLWIAPNVNVGMLPTTVFRDNAQAGVYVASNAQVTLSGDTFLDNRYGVFVQDAAPSILNSGFQRGSYGIWVNGTRVAALTGLSMLNHVVSGVRVQDAAAAVTVIEGVWINVTTTTPSSFGILAIRAAPKVSNTTILATAAARFSLGVGIAFDTPDPGARPFVVATTSGGVGNGKFGILCFRASCIVRGIGLASQQQLSFADWDVSSSTFGPGNVIGHLGGDLYSIAVNQSNTYVHNNTLFPTEYPFNANASTLRVENVTTSMVGNVNTWLGSVASNLLVRDSSATGPVMGASAVIARGAGSVQFFKNTFRFLHGIEVTRDGPTGSTVIIQGNRLTGRYYPPGYPFSSTEAEQGLLKIYNNATADIRYNELLYSAWGISLDDTLPTQASYALIQNNWVNQTGYVAIGADESTRMDVQGNVINRANGWGIFLESRWETARVGPDNRIENNSINDCHGISTAGYGGCIRMSWEEGMNDPGEAWVANNTVTRGNATGIYVRTDYTSTLRDNTVSNVTGKTVNEYGECIVLGSGIPVPVVKNTLRDCRVGIWVQKGAGHDLTRNTVQNTTVANVTWGLRLDDTGGAIVWANVHDNNTFSGWTYGVWINAAVVDVASFRLFWNDVRLNGEGVKVTGDPPGTDFFHAECNWWNHDTGPFDPSGPAPAGLPDWNPSGQGQYVSDYFFYREKPPTPAPRKGWLNNQSSALGTICLVAP